MSSPKYTVAWVIDIEEERVDRYIGSDGVVIEWQLRNNRKCLDRTMLSL